MSRHNLKQILDQIWFPFLKRFRPDREQVFQYKEPDLLAKELDFTLAQTKDLSENDLVQILEKVIEYTPNSWSPYHLNYLYSSPDPVGLIADWLVSLVNSNVHAYEASPVFALAEIEVIRTLAEIVGYGADSDGIFCPGGSSSNMFAMYLALKHFYPEAINDGLWRKDRLVIFTSEQSHFSIDKAAAFLGLGAKSVRKIKCDRHGRMVPDDLRQKIEAAQDQGERPFFVNMTMGTTVLGAFDPQTEIKNILSSRKIWLHADAAWGGAVLMSNKRREMIEGLQRADSIAWDLHKAMRSPLLCAALLVKNGSHLKNSFVFDGSYLFHGSEEIQTYHLGEKTPQCGRRGDAFKFWLMWKMRGKDYFAREVERRFAKTAEAVDMIQARPCFWLYDDQPDFWNLCFWYVPGHLRKLGNIDQCSQKDKAELEKLTVRLYECMQKDGQILVNYSSIKNYPAFIRFITGPKLTRESIKKILDIIESLGKILSSSLSKILISGGDDRLQLDEQGLNYIQIAPKPASKNLVSRSSCSGSFISADNYKYVNDLYRDIRAAKVSFPECMQQVHDRMRRILTIDSKDSIITVSCGTDAEYIPLLISKAYTGDGDKIVSIVTGAGEIGAHSATAANGLYYSSLTPCGEKVDSADRLIGIGDNVKVITISQHHHLTGQQTPNQDVWIKHVHNSLSKPGTLALLHIVDSSKLGRRMDVIDEVERLRAKYSGRLLVTIDSCQSRTDINRTRNYLQHGYMVMITGSKFEEGPPFSGAVIVPHRLTGSLTANSFINFLPALGKFINPYDVSGDMEMIRPYLPGWMNWGLMMRWTSALTNWENYRHIEDQTRNQLIQNWVDAILKLVAQYPQLEVLNGGETQAGAVGERNTIISLKLLSKGDVLPLKVLKSLYYWLYEDMRCRFPADIRLSHAEKAVLQRSFLIGQPVELGNFAVLRIALGMDLVFFMEKYGVEAALADDRALLLKLSLLLKHHESLRASDS